MLNNTSKLLVPNNDLSIDINEQFRRDMIYDYFRTNPNLRKLKKNTPILKIPFTVISANNILYKVSSLNEAEIIENGTEGKIKISQRLHSNQLGLVKVRKASSIDLIIASRNEAKLSSLFRNNFIQGYQEIYNNETKSVKTYMFMNRLPGIPLGKFDPQHLSKTSRMVLLYNLMMELKALSIKGINHNDINSDNILIDENLNVYLIDFGRASAHLPNNQTYGYDFNAMHEIIDNLNLLEEHPTLKNDFNEKLEEAGNDENGYSDVNIDDLIDSVKQELLDDGANLQPPAKKRRLI